MAPPPPPPTPNSDMRLLMIIFGGVICAIGLCGLCIGGSNGSMFLSMPQAFAQAQTELDAELMDPDGTMTEADKEMLARFLEIQEKLLPLIPLMGLAFAMGTLVSTGLTIWLGVGTILCLRWSWKLLYSIGWLYLGWLAISTISMLGMIPSYIQMMEAMNEAMSKMAASVPPPTGGTGTPAPAPPPMPTMPSVGVMSSIGVISTIIMMLIYSVPGVLLIILFGLRDVKVTCELYDRKPRWTDKVPVPVLILWLAYAGGLIYVICLAPMLPLVQVLFPDFNLFGAYFLLILGIAFTLAMLWLLAKVKPIAWWITLAATALSAIVTIIFLSNLSPELYWQVLENMGFSEEMRTQIEEEMNKEMPGMLDMMFSFATGWLPIVLSSVGVIGYLIWARRFFVADPAPQNPPATA